MVSTFKFRRGTAAEWAVKNPILRDGEPGEDKTNKIFKLGDGVSRWSQLPAYLSEAAVSELIHDAAPITPEELDELADQVMLDLELPDLVLLWENAKA